MKYVLLNDKDDNTTDGLFFVPNDANVESFIEWCYELFYSCKGNYSILELIEQNLPDGWTFISRWDGLKIVNY